MAGQSKCINCGTSLTGNFCSNCGQRSHVKRLSIRNFFEDYLSRLFGMDTNFLRTLRDLTFAPGKVGLTFVQGNRVKYIGPVGYFFLINTFYILTFSFLGIEIKEFLSTSSEAISSARTLDTESAALQSSIMDIISNNIKILEFLVIPFLALWGKVFFKKAKMNFFEHSVNALYVQGHMVFLKMIGLSLYRFAGIVINPYLIFINLGYFVWSCFDFYQVKEFKSILKGAFLFILSMISFLLLVTVLSIAGMIAYKKITGA